MIEAKVGEIIAAEATKEIIKQIKGPKTWRKIQRIVSRLRRRNCAVVFFGPSGTGKTTILTKLITGNAAPDYLASTDTEECELDIAVANSIFCLPGERTNQSLASEALNRVDVSSRLILCHVVSNGFHTPRRQLSELVESVGDPVTKTDLVNRFITLRKSAELESLTRFLDHLRTVNKNQHIHLLTVVNKHDLWFNKTTAVLGEYRSGSYAQVLEQSLSYFERDRVSHSLISVCTLRQNMNDAQGKKLVAVKNGIDDQSAEESWNDFSSHLLKLIEGNKL